MGEQVDFPEGADQLPDLANRLRHRGADRSGASILGNIGACTLSHGEGNLAHDEGNLAHDEGNLVANEDVHSATGLTHLGEMSRDAFTVVKLG
jgi:hypothetical protein